MAGRLTAIAGALVVSAGLFAYAGGWFTPHKLTPAAIINTFEYVDGVHSGFRRNHAKGVCVTGYFESNGQGQAISKAQVFLPGRVPIVGRFALAGGKPYADDTPQTIRSLAILFKQSDGQEWRTAMVNIPVFVVNTPQAFNEFLVASSPDPATGKNIPRAMSAFLAKHPETAAALQMIGKHPFSSGFGDSPYYALNAFRFVNAQGESTPVRWWVTPDQTFGGNSATPTGKNYLFDGLIAQLHAKPLRLAFDAQHRPARRFDSGRDCGVASGQETDRRRHADYQHHRERSHQPDARYQFRSAGAAGWDIALGRPAAERAVGGVFAVLYASRRGAQRAQRNFNGGG